MPMKIGIGIVSFLVICIRPGLPEQEFFLGRKVCSGDAGYIAIATAVHDAVLVFLVQSVVALVIKHCFSSVQIFVGNLNGRRRAAAWKAQKNAQPAAYRMGAI